MADVMKVFRVLHGEPVMKVFRAVPSSYESVIKIFTSVCGSYPVRMKSFRVVHEQARYVIKVFRVVHQAASVVQRVFRVVHFQHTWVVQRVFRVVHDMYAGSGVMKVFRALHGIVSDSSRIEWSSVYVKAKNQNALTFTGGSLTADEGKFVWEASVTVMSDWDGEVLLGLYDPVTYHRHGVDYSMIVVNKTRNEAIGENQYSYSWDVDLASPAYMMSEAVATPITKKWPRGSSAKGIAQELCDSYGVTLDWRIPDYVIGELDIVNQSPIDTVRTVINVVGAILQSSPDGTLIVRLETPVVPSDSSVVDCEFDALSITSVSEEGNEERVLYNAVLVSDSVESGTGSGLQHEEVARGDGGKDVKAWAEPWGVVTLRVNSGVNETLLIPRGIAYQEITEWVQFVDGKASASKPVYGDFSIEQYNGAAPGAVEWVQDSRALTAAVGSEHYCKIRYVFRYYLFVYYSETGLDYQVIQEDAQ